MSEGKPSSATNVAAPAAIMPHASVEVGSAHAACTAGWGMGVAERAAGDGRQEERRQRRRPAAAAVVAGLQLRGQGRQRLAAAIAALAAAQSRVHALRPAPARPPSPRMLIRATQPDDGRRNNRSSFPCRLHGNSSALLPRHRPMPAGHLSFAPQPLLPPSALFPRIRQGYYSSRATQQGCAPLQGTPRRSVAARPH